MKALRVIYLALMYASERWCGKVISILLNANASVHTRDNDGQTALFRAVALGKAIRVQSLISADADVHITDKKGRTPLLFAAGSKDGYLFMEIGEALQTLITANANVNIVDEEGRTALMLAAEKGDAAVVNALVSACVYVHAFDSIGNTALSLSIRKGYAESSRALVPSESALQINDENNHTVFGCVLEEEEVLCVQSLIGKIDCHNVDKGEWIGLEM